MLRGHKVTILRRFHNQETIFVCQTGISLVQDIQVLVFRTFQLNTFYGTYQFRLSVFQRLKSSLRKPSNANSIVRSRRISVRISNPLLFTKALVKGGISTPFRERITLIVLFKMSSLIAPSSRKWPQPISAIPPDNG